MIVGVIFAASLVIVTAIWFISEKQKIGVKFTVFIIFTIFGHKIRELETPTRNGRRLLAAK